MVRFIPVEIVRKKVIPFEVLPFYRFYRNDRNVFLLFVWLTSSGPPLEAVGEKWRSFPRRVMVFCKWHNSNSFLFSEMFLKFSTICQKIFTEISLQSRAIDLDV